MRLLILMKIKRITCVLHLIWWIFDDNIFLGDHTSNLFLLILLPNLNMLEHLMLKINHLASQNIWRCVEETIPLFVDNSSANLLTNNPKFHYWSKHINNKYYFIRHYVEAKVTHMTHCSNSEKITDTFSKALVCEMFEKIRMLLGMWDVP